MQFRLALVLTLVSGCAFAQTPDTGAWVSLPALTPVILKLDEDVSSNRHKTGDKFRLHVAADVRAGDLVLIPAGSAGVGEVIHAQPSGMGGRAGELIVAARYVEAGGKRVRLRSFAPGAGTGDQHVGASWATSVLIGLPGLLVQGGTLIMPRDMVANAKTAQAVRLPAVQPQEFPKESDGDEPKTD